jgi:hypothetical protein
MVDKAQRNTMTIHQIVIGNYGQNYGDSALNWNYGDRITVTVHSIVVGHGACL